MVAAEILSPAGDRERLEAAIRYGADAVYLGGTQFGMRAACPNFNAEQLCDAVSYAHAHGVKVYLTCNTLPTNAQADQLREFLHEASAAQVDALIVADIGVMMLARRELPKMTLHVSTQVGVMNYLTAAELYHLGASRVVLARELSMQEIRELRQKTPPQLELEAFVHGAMCMSVSGRCLLSSYLTGRDANRGACAQPCRWSYALAEEKRPGQYFPIGEGEEGSFILNAKDLCMIEHLQELMEAGVCSLKIEGRAKSAYYVATVTNAYRTARDLLREGNAPPLSDWVLQEVEKVSHRPYSTGFYYGVPDQCCESGGYLRAYDVVAVVEDWQEGILEVSERNHFCEGDIVEAMLIGQAPFVFEVREIIDLEEGRVSAARHPMRRYRIPLERELPKGIMLRRRNG